MPRGMRGTGPGARKRLQRHLGYDTESAAYTKLYLNEEETRVFYNRLTQPPPKIGTREGAIEMNMIYRITEQVMAKTTADNKKPKPRKR